MKSLLLFFLTCIASTAWAQIEGPTYVRPSKSYKYRVYFTDKKHNTYSTKHPENFLSEKALKRREKYNIKVDKYDLPVTQLYLDYLNTNHFKVVNVSKWNNTAVVEVSDTAVIDQLSEVTFIQSAKKVWESPDSLLVNVISDRLQGIENRHDTLENYYGKSQRQIEMLNLNRLHKEGFNGEGVTIAIIDGGFYNGDHIEGLSKCKVLGTRNFVTPSMNVYEEPQQHGTMVLSCIAAKIPYGLVGTAPEAQFYLLVSEDNDSENIIEEDNWCAALEYADSVGADVVTSSLGYFKFDDSKTTHKYHELDGQTAINSRSASLAASRGLLILNSAGNEADKYWKKIGFPADAKNIITVGAVDENQRNTLFSSLGNTADGRIKPDVMAMGKNTWLLDCLGNVTTADGTSFSTPLVCGAAACLLQAFPKAKPVEIIQALHCSGTESLHPNNVLGYGIPDIWKAYKYLKEK